MSSNYFGDLLGQEAPAGGWTCCEHCDHDPGYEHAGPCLACDGAPPL
jgi:hypothetical protein